MSAYLPLQPQLILQNEFHLVYENTKVFHVDAQWFELWNTFVSV
jgi:hypothetical protein